MVYHLNLKIADACFARALTINPASTMAHHYRGLMHIARGNLTEALASIQRAQALEPLR